MNQEQEDLLALLIINLGGSFKNVYRLCRALEWKFKIIHCHIIIDHIIKAEYVTYTMSHGIKDFDLTGKGKEIINTHRESFISALKLEYGNSIDFIENL